MGSTDQPLYQQVAAYLRAGILTGRYTNADFPVPSSFALSDKFGCGNSTVSRAYGALKDEGLIDTRRGHSGRVLVRPYPSGDDGWYMAVLARGEHKLFCTSCWQQVTRGTKDEHVC